MTLADMASIYALHTLLLSVMQEIKKVFQGMPEGLSQIIKKINLLLGLNMAVKDIFLPCNSTRIPTTPLFFY